MRINVVTNAGTAREIHSGKFITLEGGEGAGKSSLIPKLKRFLETHDIDVVVTREPGGSPGAEQIRRLLVEGDVARWDATTEALLLYAARRNHVETLIKPALSKGQWVLCDRFADSSRVYQGVGMGLDANQLDQIHQIALASFAPDLTLLIDVPVEIGLERSLKLNAERSGKGKGPDESRYEKLDRAFHQRVRDAFLNLAKQAQNRFAVIDGAMTVEAVEAGAIAAIRKRLHVGV